MTTIAYKNGVLAADGRLSVDGTLVCDNYPKIVDCAEKDFKLNGEKVLAYGFSGFLKAKEVFEYALGEGVNVTSSLDTDDDFSCIVVTEKNAFLVSKHDEGTVLSFIHISENVPMACGSGRKVALHYLTHKDCDPLDAVSEAVKSDLYSGGETMRWARS